MLPLLLAMQAAGMVVDYLGTKNQQDFAEYGAKIQQAGMDAQLMQTRLEAEDASLQGLRSLRQQLGTQAAIFAERGTRSGAGTAALFTNEAVSNFNADERTRRINLLGRKNELKGQKAISILQQKGEKSKMWQGFRLRNSHCLSRWHTPDRHLLE